MLESLTYANFVRSISPKRFLRFGLALLSLILWVGNARALNTHIEVVQAGGAAYPGNDIPIVFIVAVGEYVNNVFIPDGLTHTYSLLRGDDSAFSMVSPRVGSFKGYDTLRANLHTFQDLPGSQNALFVFLFDSTHMDSCLLGGTCVETFVPFQLTAYPSSIKIGAKATINMTLANGNPLPVTVISLSLAGDSGVSFVGSSMHLPFEMTQPNNYADYDYFQVRVAPRDTISLVQCHITVITQWGNDWLDTQVFSQGFSFVDPEPGECLTANDLRIDDFNPFGYSSTKKIPLFNPQPVPVKVTNAYIDTGYLPPWTSFLHFDSLQFPLVVQPHDSSFVSVTLSVPADSAMQFEYGYQQAYINYDLASLDSDGIACPYSSSTIEVLPFRLLPDTLAIPLFSSASTPIYFGFDPDGLLGAEDQFVRFINNGPSNVTVSSRTLFPDSIGFSTPYWGYSSDTVLKSNGTYTACVEWNPYFNDIWYDTSEYILLHFADGTETRHIPIIVYEEGVSERPKSSVQFSIVPNPASGYSAVNMSGFERVSIHISDAIGREVKPPVEVLGPDYTLRLALDNLSSGTYFITIQGVDSGGQNFSQSQVIVVSP